MAMLQAPITGISEDRFAADIYVFQDLTWKQWQRSAQSEWYMTHSLISMLNVCWLHRLLLPFELLLVYQPFFTLITMWLTSSGGVHKTPWFFLNNLDLSRYHPTNFTFHDWIDILDPLVPKKQPGHTTPPIDCRNRPNSADRMKIQPMVAVIILCTFTHSFLWNFIWWVRLSQLNGYYYSEELDLA